MAATIPEFECQGLSFRGVTRLVLTDRTEGPPVILLREVLGMSASVIPFAAMIRDAGYRPHRPVLYGP